MEVCLEGDSAAGPEKKRLRMDVEVEDLPELLEFSSWLQSEGAQRGKLAFTDSSEYGRGGIAKVDIHVGEEIASIPVGLVLTTRVARESHVGRLASPVVDRIMQEAGDAVTVGGTTTKQFLTRGRVLLCLFMIHQKFCLGEQQGGGEPSEKSWVPYLKSLPTRYTTPLWWSPDELDWIRGTNLLHAVDERKEYLQRVIADTLLSELSKSHPDIFPQQHFTLQNFVWAYTACSSRSFPSYILRADKLAPIPAEEEFDECLLPCLDMLNHQYRKKISWVLDTNTQRLQFVAEEEISRGTEAFNNYGPKGNEELLLGYGFCIPDNPQDSFMVKTTLPPSDPLAALKKDLLDSHGIPNIHPLHAHPAPSVFSALRVAVMNEAELYFYEKSSSQPDSSQKVEIPMQNLRNELEMLKMLQSLISFKMQQLISIGFEGIDEEDIPTVNIANAILYLKGQKNALLAAYGLTREMQQVVASQRASQFVNSPKVADPDSLYCNCPLWLSSDKKTQWRISTRRLNPFLDTSFASFLVSEKIAKGEPAISIPQKFLMTADRAAESPSFGPVLEMVEGMDDEETVLTLYIMHERSRGKKSKWNNFLSALPTEWNTTLYWTEEEMELLGGHNTNLSFHTQTRLEEIKQQYSQLFPALSAALPKYFPESVYTFENFLWASTLVQTHSFEVVIDGSPQTCILPLPEMPRHHPFAPTSVGFNAESKSFCITSLVDMEKGEELFIQFPGASGGDNDRLLWRYGYVPCKGENEFFNTISILIPREGLDEQKISLLRARRMSLSHLVRGTGTHSAKLINALAICVLPEEEILEAESKGSNNNTAEAYLAKRQVAEALDNLIRSQCLLPPPCSSASPMDGEEKESTTTLRMALAREYSLRRQEIVSHHSHLILKGT